MPFKSEAQRKWMHANKPEMAKRWEDHTADDAALPEKVKEAAPKKPFRNRVDVFALDAQDRLYSGVYPDGSIGPFGGGIDRGETVPQAARREFLEEAGRKIKNVQRLDLPVHEESRLAREGWRNAGKDDRLQKFRGTRSFAVLADIVKGKPATRSEPADHIKQVKYRALPEAIEAQQQALKDAPKGRKGVLRFRLKALEHISNLREKVADAFDSPVAPVLLGGGMGGAAAHYMVPTEAAQIYRGMAEGVPQAQISESLAQSAKGKVAPELMSTVDDVTAGGKRVRFQAPAFAKRRYLLDRALQANAPRLAKGIGLGLLGGYTAHKLMERPDEYKFAADRVLQKVAHVRAGMKLAIDEDASALDYTTTGAGVGSLAGLGSGVIKSLPAVKQMVQIQGQLPNLMAQRDKIRAQVRSVRQASPASLEKLTDRSIVNRLLQMPASPEQYYALRRGKEEGLIEASRANKTLNLLRKQVKANMLKRSLLGAGLGAGVGLLAAAAKGAFDPPE